MLTVKLIYTRLLDGRRETITQTWASNLISALAYFRPDTVIKLNHEEVRVDTAYIWPGGLSEEEVLKVWKQSRSGLGYSMTGITGPYTAAAEGW